MKLTISATMHPAILAAVRACELFITEPKRFPELAFPGETRQRRRELREAVRSVMQVQIYRMDLRTARVGIPDGAHFKGIGVSAVADLAGLAFNDELDARDRLRGRRTERAFHAINHAGYQTCKVNKAGRLCPPQPREYEVTAEGRDFRGLVAVRHFDPRLWKRLGVPVQMEAARTQASKAHAAELASRAREDAAAVGKLGRAVRRAARPLDPEPIHDPEYDAETLKVRADHQEWPIDSVRAEARRRVDLKRRMATGPPE